VQCTVKSIPEPVHALPTRSIPGSGTELCEWFDILENELFLSVPLGSSYDDACLSRICEILDNAAVFFTAVLKNSEKEGAACARARTKVADILDKLCTEMRDTAVSTLA